jgi:hypothetical protein
MYFELRLPGLVEGETRFTIKFREKGNSEWKWVRDQFGLSDGTIHVVPDDFLKRNLEDFIDGLDPEFKVDREAAQTADTLLWSLAAPIEGASGVESGRSETKLGLPKTFTRWLAICRLVTPWLLPRHGKDKFALDRDGILVSFLRKDGLSIAALAVSGVDDTSSVFKHDEDGNIVLHTRNDAEKASQARVIIAVASSFDVANAAVMYHIRKVAMSHMTANGQIPEELQVQEEQGTKPEWFEEWYDGFGFCTWNALGQDLTEQKIFDALKSLRDNDIRSKSLGKFS